MVEVRTIRVKVKQLYKRSLSLGEDIVTESLTPKDNLKREYIKKSQT